LSGDPFDINGSSQNDAAREKIRLVLYELFVRKKGTGNRVSKVDIPKLSQRFSLINRQFIVHNISPSIKSDPDVI